ncbi:MAG: hypothetical protein C0467_13115 [Planctomycetaceae bacterium]|nr:hypothetical protein [Planctomycetaceae bacterium]
MLLLIFMCAGGFGVCNQIKKKALEEIALGDTLYADGKKAEAVVKYKSGFSHATDAQKPEIIKRVADFEASSGNYTEARRWVEMGLSGGVEIAYESQPARDILSRIQRERAEAEAKKKEAEDRKKAERAEREKDRKEEAANRKRYGDSSDATTAAHTFVKRQLLFPEEAKFGILGRTSMQNPDNSWTVSGDVSSKNAFGVKVKFQFFTTVMRAENGDWREVGATVVTE